MSCKGTCSRYKAQKPVGSGRYSSGQRRCQTCEVFIRWEGLWCPCCGARLRTKPRNLKYKAKLRATMLKAGEQIVIDEVPYVLVELKYGNHWLLRNRETSENIEKTLTGEEIIA